jgi:hypothetical protein
MIYYDDTEKRARLLKSFAYITKSDQHLQVRLSDQLNPDGSHKKSKDHCFIKGQVSARRSRAGRPRMARESGSRRRTTPPSVPGEGWIDDADLF